MPAKPPLLRLLQLACLGSPGWALGEGRGGRWVFSWPACQCEFLCPRFFQIYSDEHNNFYNETMQSFNKLCL